MTLALIPEADALVAGWLRAHPAIVSLDANVAGTLPDSITRPWIRVTSFGPDDDETSRLEHLLDYFLQLDCYAGSVSTKAGEGQGEASTLVRTARAVLREKQGQTLDGVVVCEVRFGGMPRIPDTYFEPARERYALDVFVRMHAAVSA